MATHSDCTCGACVHGMEAFEAQTLAHIRDYGCSVIRVPGCFGASTFVYSVGLWQTAQAPEVCITGIHHEVATAM
jgi:hypothetical protein